MTDLDTLISDAKAYARKSGTSISTVSRKLFGDGTRINKISDGKATAWITTIERAKIRLKKLEAELESAQ